MHKVIYDRYLLKTLLGQLLLWLLFTAMIFLLGIFLERLDDMMMYKATSRQTLLYLWYQLPYWLWRAAPLAFLGASLTILERAHRDNELVALGCLGFSPLRIYAPLLIVALIFSLLGGLFFENSSPIFYAKSKEYFRTVIAKEPAAPRDIANFIAKGREGRYFVFGLLHLSPEDHADGALGNKSYPVQFEKFWLDEWDGLTHIREIFASKGRYDPKDGVWILEGAAERSFSPSTLGQSTPEVTTKIYEELSLKLSESPQSLLPNSHRPEEMTLDQIQELTANYKQRGITQRALLAEYDARRSSPFSFLVLCLIATTVVSRVPQKLFKGKLLLFGITIIVGVIYWFFVGLAKTFAIHGIMSSKAAAWSVHLLLAFLATIFRL